MICTHCGATNRKLTSDHVFPQCTYIGASKQRPPVVDSCEVCNGTANETIFKSFLPLLDSRHYQPVHQHVKSPKGKKELQDIRDLSGQFGDMTIISLGPSITEVFTKMFMGLHRYLDRPNWFHLPSERFRISRVNVIEGDPVAWPLPQTIQSKKHYIGISNDSYNTLESSLTRRFRDYSYGTATRNDEYLCLVVRYEVNEYAALGNNLLLLCTVWDKPSEETKRGLKFVA